MPPKRRRLRMLSVSLIATGLAVGIILWQVRTDQHREALNITLSQAIGKWDIREVRRLIDEGADPNTPEEYKPIQESFVARLKRILHRLPPPQSGSGSTPLMVAAAHEDLELVRKLLKRGANPNALSDREQTPLDKAVEGFTECTNKGGNGKPSKATAREVMRVLLDAGADPNEEPPENEGYTPYRKTIELKDDTVDRLFLKYGAKSNLEDHYGRTALWVAVEHGRTELVRRMITEGSDPNQNDSRNGCSLLSLAAVKSNMAIARLILDAGAKFETDVDSFSDGPLILAIRNDASKEMVKFLLDNGANPTFERKLGGSAFYWADKPGGEAIMEMLEVATKKWKVQHGKR